MIKIRKSSDRGFADHGWLKARHSFSFANYYDPHFMGFRDLIVINEDRIAGGNGFEMHGHRAMEIITYVVSGQLEHRDSKGHSSVIRPGEIQRMSAGGGVMHSEFNKSADKEVHLLQIWIKPDQPDTQFAYDQESFENQLLARDMALVVSKTGRDGSIYINQDVDIYVSKLQTGKSLQFELRKNRHVWIQLVRGELNINGVDIAAGDAISTNDESLIRISSKDDAEFLIFDLC